MMKKVKTSRKFAVLLNAGDVLGVYFVYHREETVEMPYGQAYAQVDWKTTKSLVVDDQLTNIPVSLKGALTTVLTAAGLTVRFFDDEEKQWMDVSKEQGSVRAPGNRDGSWGPPTNLVDLERDYLAVK